MDIPVFAFKPVHISIDPTRPEINGGKERRLITARVEAQVIRRALVIKRTGDKRPDQPVFRYPIIRTQSEIIGCGAAVAGFIGRIASVLAAITAKHPALPCSACSARRCW